MQCTPQPGAVSATLSDVPAFPDDTYTLNVPEVIGDFSRPKFLSEEADPSWTRQSDDKWECRASVEDELSYVVRITPDADVVNIDFKLTNESDRLWEQSYATVCVNLGAHTTAGSTSYLRRFNEITDFECSRHWTGINGECRQLTQLPRAYGPRPTIQIYGVENESSVDFDPVESETIERQIPDVEPEGWLAIEARDESGLVAVAAEPPFMLFQNSEYSCIHSDPGFGTLLPGETSTATTRIYLVTQDIEKWYSRYRQESSC